MVKYDKVFRTLRSNGEVVQLHKLDLRNGEWLYECLASDNSYECSLPESLVEKITRPLWIGLGDRFVSGFVVARLDYNDNGELEAVATLGTPKIWSMKVKTLAKRDISGYITRRPDGELDS